MVIPPSFSKRLAHRQARPSILKADVRLLVVIVNYRSGDLAVDCLAALADQVMASADTEVVVADNDSADGSAERIARAIETRGWSTWARLQANPVNGGFAYGNNRVI